LRGRPALDEGSGLPWHSPLVAALRLALPRAPPGGRHETTPAIIGDMARVKAEIESAQINAQTFAAKAKANIAAIQMKNQAAIEEHRMRLQQMQLQAQMDAHKLQSEHQVAMQKLGVQHQLAQTQATADQQSAQAAHALEQTKQAGAQKTLAQTAQIDEHRMVAKQDKRDREDGGDHAPLDELGIETRGEPVTAGMQ
jgi:hypothetical protein